MGAGEFGVVFPVRGLALGLQLDAHLNCFSLTIFPSVFQQFLKCKVEERETWGLFGHLKFTRRVVPSEEDKYGCRNGTNPLEMFPSGMVTITLSCSNRGDVRTPGTSQTSGELRSCCQEPPGSLTPPHLQVWQPEGLDLLHTGDVGIRTQC